MKKVAIVSCNKWIGKLQEDINLRDALIKIGVDAKIISWQQPLDDSYDLLIIRSIWGYQNYYKEFKEWLMYLKRNNIKLVNNVEMILDNIMKDKQFRILQHNGISYIETLFFEYKDLANITSINLTADKPFVIKPTISGSGENTYLITDIDNGLPNTINKNEIVEKYSPLLNNNEDGMIMVQPFIPEISNGEYSCIFIDGLLTHTMLRFPNTFHQKKRPYLLTNVPKSIIDLAVKVESIPEYKNYLYMRIDMVLVAGEARIMEVELADPDLLTKYIDDDNTRNNIIGTFARKIERRIK